MEVQKQLIDAASYDYIQSKEKLAELSLEIEKFDTNLSKNLKLFSECDNFTELNPGGIEFFISSAESALENKTFSETNISLFNPQIPSKEDKEQYRDGHALVYTKGSEDGEIANLAEITQDFKANHKKDGVHGYVISFDSGMYGGKSTRAFMLTEELRQQGFKVIRMMPASMRDKGITIRGGIVKNIDLKNRTDLFFDGENIIAKADIKIDPSDPQWVTKTLQILLSKSSHNQKTVVHFDEFSFLPPDKVSMLISAAKNSGISLILAGLTNDYLDETLPAYSASKNLIDKKYMCKSFLKGRDIINGKQIPTGTKTGRYIKLTSNGEEFWALDAGFADVFIPKENREVVYIAEHVQTHISNLCKNAKSKFSNMWSLITSGTEIIAQKKLKIKDILESRHKYKVNKHGEA